MQTITCKDENKLSSRRAHSPLPHTPSANPSAAHLPLLKQYVSFTGFDAFVDEQAADEAAPAEKCKNNSFFNFSNADRTYEGISPSMSMSLTAYTQLAKSMGAMVQTAVTKHTNVLIARRGLTKKRLVAQQHGVKVVLPQWLELGATGTTEMFAVPWLYGYQLACTTELSEDRFSALLLVIERHGGKLSRQVHAFTDALLVSSEEAALLRQASRKTRLVRPNKDEGLSVGPKAAQTGYANTRNEMVSTAWKLEVPVLEYLVLLRLSRLSDEESLQELITPSGAAERTDFDTITEVTQLRPPTEPTEQGEEVHPRLENRSETSSDDEEKEDEEGILAEADSLGIGSDSNHSLASPDYFSPSMHDPSLIPLVCSNYPFNNTESEPVRIISPSTLCPTNAAVVDPARNEGTVSLCSLADGSVASSRFSPWLPPLIKPSFGPYLVVTLLGGSSEEKATALRYCGVCRFLLLHVPSVYTDVVVLGTSIVRRKKHTLLPRERLGKSLKRLRSSGGLKEANEKESIYFYEADSDVRERIQSTMGVHVSRIAPWRWLRECYTRAHATINKSFCADTQEVAQETPHSVDASSPFGRESEEILPEDHHKDHGSFLDLPALDRGAFKIHYRTEGFSAAESSSSKPNEEGPNPSLQAIKAKEKKESSAKSLSSFTSPIMSPQLERKATFAVPSLPSSGKEQPSTPVFPTTSTQEEQQYARDQQEAHQVLGRWVSLLQSDEYPSSCSTPEAFGSMASQAVGMPSSPLGALPELPPVFKHGYFCFLNEEFSRVHSSVVRALIKFSSGRWLKEKNSVWQRWLLKSRRPTEPLIPAQRVSTPALLMSTASANVEKSIDRHHQIANEESTEALRPPTIEQSNFVEVVKREIFKSRQRKQSLPHRETASYSSKNGYGSPENNQMPSAGVSGSLFPFIHRMPENAEDYVASVGSPASCGSNPAVVTSPQLSSDKQRMVFHVIPHHYQKPAVVFSGASHDGGKKKKKVKRTDEHEQASDRLWSEFFPCIPQVTSDYLLACIAAEKLLDPASFFLFFTAIPGTSELSLLQYRYKALNASQGSTSAHDGGGEGKKRSFRRSQLEKSERDAQHRLPSHSQESQKRHPPPSLAVPPPSPWFFLRRYRKSEAVGISVFFLYRIPSTLLQSPGEESGSLALRSKEGASAGGRSVCGSQGPSASPSPVALRLIKTVAIALHAAVHALQGTVKDTYSFSSVTHVLLVDIGKIFHSSLSTSPARFVEPFCTAEGHGFSHEESSVSSMLSQGSAFQHWPTSDASAVQHVASTTADEVCLVTLKWLQDCVHWGRFIDEKWEGAPQGQSSRNAYSWSMDEGLGFSKTTEPKSEAVQQGSSNVAEMIEGSPSPNRSSLQDVNAPEHRSNTLSPPPQREVAEDLTEAKRKSLSQRCSSMAARMREKTIPRSLTAQSSEAAERELGGNSVPKQRDSEGEAKQFLTDPEECPRGHYISPSHEGPRSSPYTPQESLESPSVERTPNSPKDQGENTSTPTTRRPSTPSSIKRFRFDTPGNTPLPASSKWCAPASPSKDPFLGAVQMLPSTRLFTDEGSAADPYSPVGPLREDTEDRAAGPLNIPSSQVVHTISSECSGTPSEGDLPLAEEDSLIEPSRKDGSVDSSNALPTQVSSNGHPAVLVHAKKKNLCTASKSSSPSPVPPEAGYKRPRSCSSTPLHMVHRFFHSLSISPPLTVGATAAAVPPPGLCLPESCDGSLKRSASRGASRSSSPPPSAKRSRSWRCYVVHTLPNRDQLLQSLWKSSCDGDSRIDTAVRLPLSISVGGGAFQVVEDPVDCDIVVTHAIYPRASLLTGMACGAYFVQPSFLLGLAEEEVSRMAQREAIATASTAFPPSLVDHLRERYEWQVRHLDGHAAVEARRMLSGAQYFRVQRQLYGRRPFQSTLFVLWRLGGSTSHDDEQRSRHQVKGVQDVVSAGGGLVVWVVTVYPPSTLHDGKAEGTNEWSARVEATGVSGDSAVMRSKGFTILLGPSPLMPLSHSTTCEPVSPKLILYHSAIKALLIGVASLAVPMSSHFFSGPDPSDGHPSRNDKHRGHSGSYDSQTCGVVFLFDDLLLNLKVHGIPDKECGTDCSSAPLRYWLEKSFTTENIAEPYLKHKVDRMMSEAVLSVNGGDEVFSTVLKEAVMKLSSCSPINSVPLTSIMRLDCYFAAGQLRWAMDSLFILEEDALPPRKHHPKSSVLSSAQLDLLLSFFPITR